MSYLFSVLSLTISLFSNLFTSSFTSLIDLIDNTNEDNNQIVIDIDDNLKKIDYYGEETIGTTEFIIDNRTICTVDNSMIDYLYSDDYLVLFSINNQKLVITKYLFDGDNELIDCDITCESFVLISDNHINDSDFYLFINNDDVTIYKFDSSFNIINSKTLIGNGIEEVDKALLINDNLYALIYKDNLSEGDYGNGGNTNNDKSICLLEINSELEVKNVLSYDSESIINLEEKTIDENDKNNSFIGITLNDSFYLYDASLNQIFGLKFASNCILGKTMINFKGVIYYTRFLKNGIEVWDLNEGKVCYSIGYKKNKNEDYKLEYVREISDNYYGFDENKRIVNKIRMYYIQEFLDNNIYYDSSDKPSNINNYVFSLNEKIDRTSVRTIGDFDSNKAGTYLTYYFYGDLELTSKTIVYPGCNIQEGIIYPLNYCLKTNLETYLDGELVTNNYVINQDGNHVLEQYNDGMLYKSISFMVSSSMCDIDNNEIKNIEYDYYLKINEYIRLTYNVKLDNDVINDVINEEIEGFIINGELISDYDTFDTSNDNEKGVFIYLECKNEGLNKYNIDSIKIKTKNYYRFININEEYTIYGINEISEETISLEQKSKYINVNVSIDNDSFDDSIESLSLRGIYIDYYQNNRFIRRELIDYDSNKITLDKNVSDVKIGFIYDVGYKNLVDEELFSINYEKINKETIEIVIGNKEEALKEVSFLIKNTNNLVKINNSEECLFNKTIYNYSLIIIVSIIIVIIGIGINILIIYKKRIKGLFKK